MSIKNVAKVELPAIFTLILINFAIFFSHYMGYRFFPWDFIEGYYPITYYWISAAQGHLLPQWVAQQAMGYPLAMNLQSGMYYPIFEFLVFLNKTYTLHTAVVIQCLHVLAGALGMYYLARLLNFNVYIALVAAIAYHFFGGFVGNAEHADYIRSYAIFPWFLSGLLPISRQFYLRVLLVLPISIIMLITGAYPGFYITLFFIIPFWFVGHFLSYPRLRLQQYLLMGLTTTLAVMMSLIKILPPFLMTAELYRSDNYASEGHGFSSLALLPTTIFSFISDRIPNDISMRSYFITLPVFMGLFFINKKILTQFLPWIILLLLGLILSSDNMLRTLIVSKISILNISRFPVADFRAAICVSLILLAMAAYKNILAGRLSFFLLRVALFFFGFLVLLSMVVDFRDIAAYIICPLLILLFLAYRQKMITNQQFLLGIIFLTLCSGYGLWNTNRHTWKAKPKDVDVYQIYVGVNGRMIRDKILLKHLHTQPNRSARPKNWSGGVNQYGFLNTNGYLTGSYEMNDYSGGRQLKRFAIVMTDDRLSSYMSLVSQMTSLASNNELNYSPESNQSVNVLSYSNDKIIYNVHAAHAGCFVANEMYFPGWIGKIEGENALIQPFAFKKALRGWCLQKGNYIFSTSFIMPYQHLANILSLIGLLGWLILLVTSILMYVQIFHREEM